MGEHPSVPCVADGTKSWMRNEVIGLIERSKEASLSHKYLLPSLPPLHHLNINKEPTLTLHYHLRPLNGLTFQLLQSVSGLRSSALLKHILPLATSINI